MTESNWLWWIFFSPVCQNKGQSENLMQPLVLMSASSQIACLNLNTQTHTRTMAHSPLMWLFFHSSPNCCWVKNAAVILPCFQLSFNIPCVTLHTNTGNTGDGRRSDLVAAVAEGFAGQVGGQTVEDQISAGGAGGDVTVIGIEGHTGHLFFMVLRDRRRL